MIDADEPKAARRRDTAPGDESGQVAGEIRTYLIGLALATLLSAASFLLLSTKLIWGPAIPVALVVLAIAQMGVHLVFFLHITTGPDNLNNAMALAFGVLIIIIFLGGTLWIMANLNHMMPSMEQMMNMQR